MDSSFWDITLLVSGIISAAGAAFFLVFSVIYFSRGKYAAKNYEKADEKVRGLYDFAKFSRKTGMLLIRWTLVLAFFSVAFITRIEMLNNAATLFMIAAMIVGDDPWVNGTVRDEGDKEAFRGFLKGMGVLCGFVAFAMVLALIFEAIGRNF